MEGVITKTRADGVIEYRDKKNNHLLLTYDPTCDIIEVKPKNGEMRRFSLQEFRRSYQKAKAEVIDSINRRRNTI